MSTTSENGATYGPDDDGAYWRSPKTILAALVLIAIVAAGIWVITDDPTPTAAPATTAQQPAPAGNAVSTLVPSLSEASYDSACGLTGGSTQIPTSAEPGTEWRDIDGFQLPINAQHGPGKRSETGAWSCFARTPTGALLAAYTIPGRIGTAKDFAAVVKNQTVPGVGQTALLRKGQSAPTSDPAVPFGFVIDRYTSDEATVTYYLRQTGIEATCSFHVQWFGGATGDWLIRPETNGNDGVCIQGAPARYVPWGPTS
ncbi:MAG: hypothetical protein ACT4P1_15835 [Sporichthyaceae bacterium]